MSDVDTKKFLTIPNILKIETLKSCKIWAEEVADIIFDEYKVFDMFLSYNFSQMNLNRTDRIFFGGAYQDGTIQLLSKGGYNHLIGMDLKEDIYNQPNYWKIKFYRGNIIDTHMPPNFFKGYFSLSVIEHLDSLGGNIFTQITKFFQEVVRITQDGGFLILTTDYNNIPMHKKGENIFDKNDINKILDIASKMGFELVSNLDLDIIDKPVSWNGMEYTFIFLAFKLHKMVNFPSPKYVNIISPMVGQDGITIYAENLKKRFEESGIGVNLVATYRDCEKAYPVILEYDPGLFQDLRVGNHVFIEMHTTRLRLRGISYVFLKTRSIKKALKLLNQIRLIKTHKRILVRTGDLTNKFFFGLKKYSIMPHITYPDSGIRAKPSGLCIGSFGFALPFKHFDKICELAIRLNLPCVLLLSVNNASKEMLKVSTETIKQLKQKYVRNENINIQVGFFRDTEILEHLSVCSHIIFAQDNSWQTSGSYRFPVQLGIPIISTDSFQAREAQVIRVNNLDELDLKKLESIKESINLDDGFDYLINIIRYDNKE